MEAHFGNQDQGAFLRSAAKPFQALPLVEEGLVERLGLTSEELALCCASHNSEAEHVRVAASILAKAGLDESALECGSHFPIRRRVGEDRLRAGEKFRPIHSNCSGKHAGMLALAVGKGWPVEGYVGRRHPVQRRMMAEVARWTGVAPSDLKLGTDGCGVVTFALPVRRVALAFARFAAAAARGEEAGRVVDAMRGHPFLIAGTGRLCTALMENTQGRIFAKMGAEGLYGAGVPERGIGIALKVEDGAGRAADVALLHSLAELGLLRSAERAALASFHEPTLENARGEKVGEIRADFQLRGA